MKRLACVIPLFVATAAGCSRSGPDGPGVSIGVAPLSLPGISDVCYTLEVQNDAGQTVWSRPNVCSSKFGNNIGDITYIGTCDAQDNDVPTDGTATNTVTLTIENLYTGNPLNNAQVAVADSEWDNPCGKYRPGSTFGDDVDGNPATPNVNDNADGYGPCQLTFPCLENQDVAVEFNLTIMRDANQGFFDIAVEFEDVFCSAKLDCGKTLLFDPISGERVPNGTHVFGFACTAGQGTNTVLNLGEYHVQCTGAGGPWDYTFDPSGHGNLNPTFPVGHPPILFQAASYAGAEQLSDITGPLKKGYWNIAIGFDEDVIEDLGLSCTIELHGTVTDGPLAGHQVAGPGVYPMVRWRQDLYSAGTLACGNNPLNEDGSAVQTVYWMPGMPAEPMPHCYDVAANTFCESTPSGCTTAGDCNDNNPCTQDACSPETGCVYTETNCDDNDACTNDACDSETGCGHTPIECDDNDACTIDSCDSKTGCIYDSVDCSDNNECTTDTCDSESGCQYETLSCDDEDKCTIDDCSPDVGCFATDVDCNDDSACTSDSCDPATGCEYIDDVDCDDNNACTVDSCDPTEGCMYVDADCDDNDPCTVDSCDRTMGCQYVEADCNDNDACTNDYCDSEFGCRNVEITCDDDNDCTVDSCDTETGCNYLPVSCNDDNICTNDFCDSEVGCRNVKITCDDDNVCTTDSCDPDSGCVYDNVDCDDGQINTTDSCTLVTATSQCATVDPGQCVHDLVICNDNDACTHDTYNGSECVFTAKNCNDNITCTVDSCNIASGCTHDMTACVPGGCDDANPCTEDIFDDGQCFNQLIDCNDSNACTVDACDQDSGCVYDDIVCDDGNACTLDSCDPSTGCVVTTCIDCDDFDAATVDGCDQDTGCYYE